MAVTPPRPVELTDTCPHCKNGQVTEVTTAIHHLDLAHHVAEHRNRRADSDAKGHFLDQTCECRRVERRWAHKCTQCGGTGTQVILVKVPNPGDKVIVRDPKLLKAMGVPEYIGQTAVVLTLNDPKISAANAEPRGLRDTINVTWMKTNRDGKVLQKEIKASDEGIVTFAFVPRELKVIA